MSSRFFPSTFLWAALGLVALADLAAMVLTGFRLTGYGALWIVAVSAAAWGLGHFYSVARPDARLAALAFGAAYLILFTSCRRHAELRRHELQPAAARCCLRRRGCVRSASTGWRR